MRLVSLGGTLVAVLAVGCGGGGNASGGTNANNNPTSPTPSAPSSSITIVEYAFTPAADTVKAGTIVTWTNNGTIAHTATDDGGTWDSGQISSPSGGGLYGGGSAGGSYTLTFSTPGTFTYHCANHPTQMKGTIVVTP